jgi:hypothetical protein
MIDKSKAEMAAVRESGSTFLLCYFHFLQDWERFLRSSESGVSSPEARHAVMLRLAQLKRLPDKAIFEKEVSSIQSGESRRGQSSG